MLGQRPNLSACHVGFHILVKAGPFRDTLLHRCLDSQGATVTAVGSRQQCSTTKRVINIKIIGRMASRGE
jgi:hypothetical protein